MGIPIGSFIIPLIGLLVERAEKAPEEFKLEHVRLALYLQVGFLAPYVVTVVCVIFGALPAWAMAIEIAVGFVIQIPFAVRAAMGLGVPNWLSTTT